MPSPSMRQNGGAPLQDGEDHLTIDGSGVAAADSWPLAGLWSKKGEIDL